MTAFNVVRFRVKPGNAEAFIEAHRSMRPTLKGFLSGSLIRTGDQTFCMVGEWRNFQSIVNARPQMISMLDQVRALLEDLGGDLGLTDPVSGESLVKFGPPRKTAKKRSAKPGGAKKGAARRTKGKAAARRSAPKKRKR
jgi:quinol monooxygenase YgiN